MWPAAAVADSADTEHRHGRMLHCIAVNIVQMTENSAATEKEEADLSVHIPYQ